MQLHEQSLGADIHICLRHCAAVLSARAVHGHAEQKENTDLGTERHTDAHTQRPICTHISLLHCAATVSNVVCGSVGEKERIVLGTDTGELLIVEGTELKATLQLDLGSTVHSIAAYAKVRTTQPVQPVSGYAFICGNSDPNLCTSKPLQPVSGGAFACIAACAKACVSLALQSMS